MDASGKKINEKLQAYVDEWTKFRLGFTNADNLFDYLNRSWIKRQLCDRTPGVYQIGDVIIQLKIYL